MHSAKWVQSSSALGSELKHSWYLRTFLFLLPAPFSFHVFLWVWGVCWGSGHTRQALSDWAMSQCSESGFYHHGFISLFSNFTQTAFPSAGTCSISAGIVVSIAHGVSEFWLLQTQLWWPHVDTPVVYVDRNRHEQTEVTQVHVGLSCPAEHAGHRCGTSLPTVGSVRLLNFTPSGRVHGLSSRNFTGLPWRATLLGTDPHVCVPSWPVFPFHVFFFPH